MFSVLPKAVCHSRGFLRHRISTSMHRIASLRHPPLHPDMSTLLLSNAHVSTALSTAALDIGWKVWAFRICGWFGWGWIGKRRQPTRATRLRGIFNGAGCLSRSRRIGSRSGLSGVIGLPLELLGTALAAAKWCWKGIRLDAVGKQPGWRKAASTVWGNSFPFLSCSIPLSKQAARCLFLIQISRIPFPLSLFFAAAVYRRSFFFRVNVCERSVMCNSYWLDERGSNE